MTVAWETIGKSNRLLMEARLEPVQGGRFQPTGFPDLGHATYQLPDQSRTEMLMVESAQSMANRLEYVCWDEAQDELQAPLQGIPYVRVQLWNGQTTNSILEAHRLNSPYIMSDESFQETFRNKAGIPQRARAGGRNQDDDENTGDAGLVDRRTVAQTLLLFDPSSILHGVFLEKLDGRVRLQRCLSSFIEARNVRPAEHGGVKNDRVAPRPAALRKAVGLTVTAREGYGNVPFHRTEYVAESITAYFNLDLAQLRAYGLGDAADRFLVTLALWKVRRFLENGLRLRTACDLELAEDLQVKKPSEFVVPQLEELEESLPGLVQDCAGQGLFANPPITELKFQTGAATRSRRSRAGSVPSTGPSSEGSMSEDGDSEEEL